MNRKNSYKDMEKYRRTCGKQRKRYYDKTSNLYPPKPWTALEDAMVIHCYNRDSYILDPDEIANILLLL